MLCSGFSCCTPRLGLWVFVYSVVYRDYLDHWDCISREIWHKPSLASQKRRCVCKTLTYFFLIPVVMFSCHCCRPAVWPGMSHPQVPTVFVKSCPHRPWWKLPTAKGFYTLMAIHKAWAVNSSNTPVHITDCFELLRLWFISQRPRMPS